MGGYRMSPLLAFSQLLNRLTVWLYAHPPTPNQYVLALAVVLAGYIAFRLVRRLIGWLSTAAVVAVTVIVAYRLVVG